MKRIRTKNPAYFAPLESVGKVLLQEKAGKKTANFEVFRLFLSKN